MLLIGDITFPRWNGDDQFDPYITEKQLDDALNHGKSLDAAERTAGANEFLSVNSDANITGKLLLKAVDKRRADVVRFMVERGADLNHLSQLTVGAVHAYPQESSVLHTAVRYGRYSDAAFVLDLGDAVNVDVPWGDGRHHAQDARARGDAPGRHELARVLGGLRRIRRPYDGRLLHVLLRGRGPLQHEADGSWSV